MLTKQKLKKLIIYEPNSGIIRWRESGSGRTRNLYCGWYDKIHGYHKIEINSISYQAHRLAFLYMKGYLPENQVDHKDRNRENNKWDNLREVSQQCNSQNCNLSKNNKSGVTGVYKRRKSKKWRSYIRNKHKLFHLGNYDNIEGAVRARWDAEVNFNWGGCNSTSTAYLYLKENNLL